MLKIIINFRLTQMHSFKIDLKLESIKSCNDSTRNPVAGILKWLLHLEKIFPKNTTFTLEQLTQEHRIYPKNTTFTLEHYIYPKNTAFIIKFNIQHKNTTLQDLLLEHYIYPKKTSCTTRTLHEFTLKALYLPQEYYI